MLLPTSLHSLQVLLLNNQHLGMVVQWEDRFYKVRVGFTG
jgi:thiamine pyrophosphate-dependent acetolactate synthase large subunit-like protein